MRHYLFILQCHVIGFLQFRQYWNKAAPTSFRGRRFVTFHDMRAQPSLGAAGGKWLTKMATFHFEKLATLRLELFVGRVKYPNLGTFVNVLYFVLPNFLHNIY